MNLIKFYKKPATQPILNNNKIANARLLEVIEKEKGNLICSGEIDLVISYNPYFYNWIRYADGTICLIRDINEKIFIFRLYNSIPFLLWEHEILSNKVYIKLNDNFYYFTTKDFNFGFKFFSTNEATDFFSHVDKIKMQKKHSGNKNNSINNRLLNKSNKIKSKLSIFQFNKKEVNTNNNNDVFEDFLNKLEIKRNTKRIEFLKEFCTQNGGLDFLLKEFENQHGPSWFNYNKQTDSLNNLMLNTSTQNKNNNSNNNSGSDLIQLNDLNLNTDFDSISVYNFTEDFSTDTMNESFKYFSSKIKSNDLSFIEKLKIDLLALSDTSPFTTDGESD